MAIIVKDDNIQVERMLLEPYGTNAYIITCLKTKASVLIDAPSEAETIIRKLKDTVVKYILLTHNHEDHTGALVELRKKLGVPLAAHQADSKKLPVQPDMFLKNGDILSVGELKLDVIHTPGHTPGCLCFRTGTYLFSGDTIFSSGPGRTFSPSGLKQIIQSITTKIFTLPDDTQIFPGHGKATVLKKERGEYALFALKEHKPNLYGDIVWLES
jgi:hydroxyacylglutathione hydrolase